MFVCVLCCVLYIRYNRVWVCTSWKIIVYFFFLFFLFCIVLRRVFVLCVCVCSIFARCHFVSGYRSRCRCRHNAALSLTAATFKWTRVGGLWVAATREEFVGFIDILGFYEFELNRRKDVSHTISINAVLLGGRNLGMGGLVGRTTTVHHLSTLVGTQHTFKTFAHASTELHMHQIPKAPRHRHRLVEWVRERESMLCVVRVAVLECGNH